MTRKELIQAVHGQLTSDLTQAQIAEVIDATFSQIMAVIKQDGRYVHPGFGSFVVRHCQARPGIHPGTGAPISIAEANRIAFNPAKQLKNLIQS